MPVAASIPQLFKVNSTSSQAATKNQYLLIPLF